MNDNTESEYEYRVMVRNTVLGWYNAYGSRAYPSLATARGLKSYQGRRYDDNVRIERRPVSREWEVIE